MVVEEQWVVGGSGVGSGEMSDLWMDVLFCLSKNWAGRL